MAARVKGVVDSFITDVRGVYAYAGAGAYLSKYLIKGEMDRGSLEELGFRRRFSRSVNWPSDEPMRRVGTVKKAWVNVSWTPGSVAVYKELLDGQDNENEMLERVGGELYSALVVQAGQRRIRGFIGRMANNASGISETSFADRRGCRIGLRDARLADTWGEYTEGLLVRA